MSTPEKSPISAERVKRHLAMRSNPIVRLSPAKLGRILDAFDAGDVRDAALLWQKIIERDDQALTCSGKRVRGTPALNWEVLTLEDSDAATAHKEALEFFYRNVSARDALDRNVRGGLRLLIAQMLSCIGMRYAPHELVWRPVGPGKVTATFNFIPLQFFENTSGELRFLETDTALYGVPMDEKFGEGGWMVTTGAGLMRAGSVCYLLKRIPLHALVNLCDKFGQPGLHAKTDAAKGTEEWKALKEALASFGEDLALLTSKGAEVQTLEAKNLTNTPHPGLIDMMDRAVSRLWMGGDLATMSQPGSGAVGSEPQGDDLGKLQEEDAALITDTLQEFVDRAVIRYLFGDVEPLAYFELQTKAKPDVDRELKVDEFLVRNGVPRGKRELLERYNRPEIEANDEPASAPPAVAPAPVQAFNEAAAGRDALFRAEAIRSLSAAQAAALRPLVTRLVNVADIEDDAEFDSALVQLRADLPGLGREIFASDATGQLAKAWENILGPALVSGAAEAAAKRKPTPSSSAK